MVPVVSNSVGWVGDTWLMEVMNPKDAFVQVTQSKLYLHIVGLAAWQGTRRRPPTYRHT